MTLQFDPLKIFRASKTPWGLYARQKWLNEESHRAWKADFQITVDQLMKGQSPEGSWDRSVLKTIQRLFGLHLTLRYPSEDIDRALDWLIQKASEVFSSRRADIGEPIIAAALRGLPFSPGPARYLVLGTTLFLATIFGRGHDERVLELYERLNGLGKENKGRWCGWSGSNNILRAFVVHPTYANTETMSLAIEALARVQNPSGRWPDQVPFYQTVNALAHLNLSQADTQLERAFKRLYETQRRDGSWGRSQRGWNTFLIVHALKNKGVFGFRV
ncbi:MAG: hypothetical protein JSV55_14530 [Deltaproteobacteria bacterium]|nr:MAG: hypothetical protein JSV55_14530 [Deltaproteobacteria bacterium]